ncbi:MAG TPA: S41 family peptidase [Sphingobacteriaceae bacterium]
MIINISRYWSCLLILAPLLFASCKKDPQVTPVVNPPTTNPDPVGTRTQLTLDSIFLYAREVYYWNDALPEKETFDPRKYISGSSDLSNYNRELFDITQIKINPLTGKPYEFVAGSSNPNVSAGYAKYSYIQDRTTKNPTGFVPDRQSSVDLEGNGNDMGLALSAIGTADNYDIRIRYASPGSPAAKAGLGRGDVITKFNGVTVGSNFDSEVNHINNAMNGTSVTIAGKKKDGTAFDRTLTKTVYKSGPIYKDTVITTGSKKVGYLAYARFSNTENSKPALDQSFAEFASAGVTDLVIDLRYNGGGYVNVAQHLTNLIAPSSLNGTKMFSEKFNSTMQSGKATILKNQPLLDANDKVQYQNGRLVTYADIDYSEAQNTYNFSKAGSLNGIQQVIFIVTGNTASASELVINNLKPHMNVKVIGKQSYGKPIGFFPITVENRYDVYYSMFTSINSVGETDYFAGFTPDYDVADDVTRDFGDPAELSFAAALRFIDKGSFIAATNTLSSVFIKGGKQRVSSAAVAVREITPENDFKGMIETRHKIKR